MPLDNWTGIALRRCSLEAFSNYVNQETNIGRLSVIGGYILEDFDRNNPLYNTHYSIALQQEYLINSVEEQEAKLRLVRTRRRYIIENDLDQRARRRRLLEELDQRTDNIVNE